MKCLLLFHELKFTAHAPEYKQLRTKFQPLYFNATNFLNKNEQVFKF